MKRRRDARRRPDRAGDRLQARRKNWCASCSATRSPRASARSGALARTRNCATCTRAPAQPGLWFIAGGLAQCRIDSKYLALQIKAIEEGLLPRDATDFFPSPLVGEGGARSAPDEGSLSAMTDPSPVTRSGACAPPSPTRGEGKQGRKHTCRPFWARASIATAWWRTGRSCRTAGTSPTSPPSRSTARTASTSSIAAPIRWWCSIARAISSQAGAKACSAARTGCTSTPTTISIAPMTATTPCANARPTARCC